MIRVQDLLAKGWESGPAKPRATLPWLLKAKTSKLRHFNEQQREAILANCDRLRAILPWLRRIRRALYAAAEEVIEDLAVQVDEWEQLCLLNSIINSATLETNMPVFCKLMDHSLDERIGKVILQDNAPMPKEVDPLLLEAHALFGRSRHAAKLHTATAIYIQNQQQAVIIKQQSDVLNWSMGLITPAGVYSAIQSVMARNDMWNTNTVAQKFAEYLQQNKENMFDCLLPYGGLFTYPSPEPACTVSEIAEQLPPGASCNASSFQFNAAGGSLGTNTLQPQKQHLPTTMPKFVKQGIAHVHVTADSVTGVAAPLETNLKLGANARLASRSVQLKKIVKAWLKPFVPQPL